MDHEEARRKGVAGKVNIISFQLNSIDPRIFLLNVKDHALLYCGREGTFLVNKLQISTHLVFEKINDLIKIMLKGIDGVRV